MTQSLIGSPAVPVYIVPNSDLEKNGGRIPVLGSPAIPIIDPNRVIGTLNPYPELTEQVYSILNCANGDNIITPTIPSGYKFVTSLVQFNNPTAGGITTLLSFKRGSTSYTIRQSLSAAANSSTPLAQAYVLESGDSLVLNTNATAMAFFVLGYLVPSTHSLKPFVNILASGDNTIYTCPTGKKARAVSLANLFSPQECFGNSSGFTRIYLFYVIPSGGSESASTLVARVSAGNAAGTNPFAFFNMVANDSLVINSDGTGAQVSHVLLLEEDALP